VSDRVIEVGTPLMQELAAAREHAAQLERAFTSRVQIDTAVGVLIERHDLSRTEAFELLRGAARSARRRIHDLAGEVVAHRQDPPELVAFRSRRT
jgi:AmiR/NasT family two-component response regulator